MQGLFLSPQEIQQGRLVTQSKNWKLRPRDKERRTPEVGPSPTRKLGKHTQGDLLQSNAATRRPGPTTCMTEFPSVPGVTRQDSASHYQMLHSVSPALRPPRLTLLCWPSRPGTPGGKGSGGGLAGNAGTGL